MGLDSTTEDSSQIEVHSTIKLAKENLTLPLELLKLEGSRWEMVSGNIVKKYSQKTIVFLSFSEKENEYTISIPQTPETQGEIINLSSYLEKPLIVNDVFSILETPTNEKVAVFEKYPNLNTKTFCDAITDLANTHRSRNKKKNEKNISPIDSPTNNIEDLAKNLFENNHFKEEQPLLIQQKESTSWSNPKPYRSSQLFKQSETPSPTEKVDYKEKETSYCCFGFLKF